ncbi:exodeoxyribonuclease III [Ochrobactrum sp. BTU1]|uniref:exodeoxyribonuclease III n=1 Tax=Ochrobactrum sp. BTU1 TaxID=2840456 RepID=UPI001C0582DD|nr:exodeoxyribonuclease III [Ochrobactrum sp. BTU1]
MKGTSVRIATYNVNGINGRLPVLMRWLKEDRPDIVALQELKTTNEKFPYLALSEIGYQAVCHGQKSWNGVAILARGQMPVLTRVGLPGDTSDTQSRYIEAAVNGILIGCLYLPNGNPVPSSKYDFKLSWLKRLHTYSAQLLDLNVPVALLGDFNIIPTDFDVYAPERWRDDALFRQQVREAFSLLLSLGWTDAVRQRHPKQQSFTFWKYWRNSFQRDAGLRIDHVLLDPNLASRLRTADVRREPRGWIRTSDHAPVMVVLD